MIICHVRPVANAIANVVGNPYLTTENKKDCTSYICSHKMEVEICNLIVINTGMIHQLDDYAKIRLGKEIELYMDQIY